MTILNEDYRNNIWVVIAFIIIVVIYVFIISNNKVDDIKYEEEEVCGFFESLNKYPRGGGLTTYTLMLNLDRYGSIVYDNVNINKYDESSKVNYGLLSKDIRFCFLIKKPKYENKWDSNFRILNILKNK